MVYEATLDGERVAVKKPILSTAEDIDKFHKELQLLWSVIHSCIIIHMQSITLCMYVLLIGWSFLTFFVSNLVNYLNLSCSG